MCIAQDRRCQLPPRANALGHTIKLPLKNFVREELLKHSEASHPTGNDSATLSTAASSHDLSLSSLPSSRPTSPPNDTIDIGLIYTFEEEFESIPTGGLIDLPRRGMAAIPPAPVASNSMPRLADTTTTSNNEFDLKLAPAQKFALDHGLLIDCGEQPRIYRTPNQSPARMRLSPPPSPRHRCHVEDRFDTWPEYLALPEFRET